MKKFLSAALVCVMLSAIVMVPVFAKQTNMEVTAYKFTEQPTIDGTISEDEWGAPVVTVKASEAADKENADQGVNEFNSYLGAVGGEIQEIVRNEMSYQIWTGWDDAYFYVAVKVHDADGHAATKSGDDIWNNDCVQMRVDPQGPDSKQVADDPSFDWKTTEWDYVKGTDSSGGFGSEGSKLWDNNKKLINAGFALVGPAEPRKAQAWDMQPHAAMPDTLFEATTYDLSGDLEDEDYACETSYEIALPWSTIGEKVKGADWVPNANDYLGMSLVVLNALGSGADSYLTWGCGVCGGQGSEARMTCGGSNAILLSGETFTPKAGYDVTPESTEETEDVAPTTTANNNSGNDTAAEKDETTTKAASDNTRVNRGDQTDDESGFPVWAIILIICAVVVVAVIVVVVVLKKKKK
jgi:hypothetical protein